jgi:hypothetical protein
MIYNLRETDEFVTKVIRVMIKFNKGIVIRSTVVYYLEVLKTHKK